MRQCPAADLHFSSLDNTTYPFIFLKTETNDMLYEPAYAAGLGEGGYSFQNVAAMNNKGIVDEYRRPKLSYETVKRIFRSVDTYRK